MKRSRFNEEQIIQALESLKSGKTTKELCADLNVSQQTLYNWKRKYEDLDVSEARRLRALEEENNRLKRIVADLTVQNDILKHVNSKKW